MSLRDGTFVTEPTSDEDKGDFDREAAQDRMGGNPDRESRGDGGLFGRVLGLHFRHCEDELWVFKLPDGSKVEVFGPSGNEHFTTGPVVEFFTDDVAAATDELRVAGVPIVSGPVFLEGEDDVAWVHFRAPDGNIYGITQGHDLEGFGSVHLSVADRRSPTEEEAEPVALLRVGPSQLQG
jgi:hypothetical protein